MDPRGIPLQVLTDLWLVRWGSEKVPARVLQEAPGDWHDIARYLKTEGIVDRIPVHFTAGSVVYQLKGEEPPCSGKQAPK